MKTKSNKKVLWFIVILGLFIIGHVITAFPVIRLNNETIYLFAPERIVSRSLYRGKIFGRHEIITNCGKITLENKAEILYGHIDIDIDINNFKEKKASHNIVVNGIKMPDCLNINININTLEVFIIVLDNQEIIVSGVPILVDRLRFNNNDDDRYRDYYITMDVGAIPGIIQLNDSNQVFIDNDKWVWGRLSEFKDTGLWKLEHHYYPAISIKLPNEEIRYYKSITFHKDWGAFIEGELFEELE